MKSQSFEYAKLLFTPFFKWWWMSAAGTASILSFLAIPDTGISLSEFQSSLVILLIFLLAFLTFTVLATGFDIYLHQQNSRPSVCSVDKCKDYQTDFVATVTNIEHITNGDYFQINRKLEEIEVPFSIARCCGTTQDGKIQAALIWISPAHLREINSKKLLVRDLVITRNIEHTALDRYLNEPR